MNARLLTLALLVSMTLIAPTVSSSHFQCAATTGSPNGHPLLREVLVPDPANPTAPGALHYLYVNKDAPTLSGLWKETNHSNGLQTQALGCYIVVDEELVIVDVGADQKVL